MAVSPLSTTAASASALSAATLSVESGDGPDDWLLPMKMMMVRAQESFEVSGERKSSNCES
jgi:hypothetical protein